MSDIRKTPRRDDGPNVGPFGFHWQSIARVLWKGKYRLLFLWMLLVLWSFEALRRWPTMYKAECLMLVVGQKTTEKYVTSAVTTAPQDRLAAISHLVLSNGRLQQIITAFDLYQRERQSLSQDQILKQMRDRDIELKLEAGLSNSNPDAFRVSYQSSDPQVAAKVANRMAQLIIDENSRTRRGDAENTSRFLEEQLKQARSSLDQLDARVSQYKLAHTGGLPEQEVSLNGTLSRLQTKLQGNQDAQTRNEQSRALLESTLVSAQASLEALESTAQNAREETFRENLAASAEKSAANIRPKTRGEILVDELASLRQRYAENHPEIKRRVAELAQLPPPSTEEKAPVSASSPAVQEIQTSPSLAAAIVSQKERIATSKTQLNLAVSELQDAKREREQIMRDIDNYQHRIDQLPVREQELAAVTRDYEIAKQNYKSLLDKKLGAGMATDLERNQEGEEFRLIEPARVPQVPIRPRGVLYGIALGLNFIVSALIILSISLPKDKLLGEWELGPGVVVLGRIPNIREHATVRTQLNPKSFATHS